MTDAEIARWCQELLPLVWNNHPPAANEADLPGGGMALLSADTDRTQSYVFQSIRLPEIRGASMLLDDLNRKQLPKLLQNRGLPTGFINAKTDQKKGCIIYIGGGSLLALVPHHLAHELCQEIETLYAQASGTATITAVYQPITLAEIRGELAPLPFPTTHLTAEQQKRLANGTETNRFRNLIKRQSLRLRQQKDSKKQLPHFETIPFGRVCHSCARRPAVDALTGIPGEPPRYLCHICQQNFKRGRENRSYWNKRFARWAEKSRQTELTVPAAQDLQTIGTHFKGYIGYIYADGNQIGSFLEKTATPLAYTERSRALLKATETAVFEAIYTHLLDQNQTTLTFEIITIGGDDLLIIVPAHKALPLAHSICTRFQQLLQDILQIEDIPSMSAGVVLAHDSNPIYFLQDLAKQLLQNAKRATKDKKEACIDYMVLKSQATVATNLHDARQAGYLWIEQEQDRERTVLTGRPYTLGEIEKLLQGVIRFQQFNFSRGQLHQMRRAFQNGRFPAIFYYLYQRTRLGRLSPTHAAALQQTEADWGMMADKNGAPPWRAPKATPDQYLQFDTPLLDMLALLDFAESKEKKDAT